MSLCRCFEILDKRRSVSRVFSLSILTPDALGFSLVFAGDAMVNADDIGNPRLLESAPGDYVFTEKGIAWPSDADKYKLTEWVTKAPSLVETKLVPPEKWTENFKYTGDNWDKGYFANSSTNTNVPDLGKWERFQVWMRTAGLPNFRKLWGKNTTTVLKKGTYEIDITSSMF